MSGFLSRVLCPADSMRGGERRTAPGEGTAGGSPPDVEVDVAVFWKGEPLLRRRVREGDTAWVGDVDGSWVRIPCAPIGVEGFRLAQVKRGEATVLAPRGARGRLERPDGTMELFGSGREVWLLPGDVVRMGVGTFSIVVTGVAVAGSRASAVGRGLRGLVARFPGGQLGLSAAFHVALLLVALLWPAGEERAAAEQAGSLSEAEVAAILAAGPEETAEEQAPIGPPVAPDGSGAWGERGGEGDDGEGDRGSATAPGPSPEAGRAPERASGHGSATATERGSATATGDIEARASTRSVPWGWWAGGALALGGWGVLRWRRSRARAGAEGRWSWAGALELGRLVTGGGRVGALGVGREGLDAAAGAVGSGDVGGAFAVVDLEAGFERGSLDVVGLAGELAAGPDEMGRAWRAVRAGGVLVVGAASGDGAALAEQVRERTGAGVVWWFERGTGGPGGLQSVVMAVKGRPPRGPKEAMKTRRAAGDPGADAVAIAGGFRGWGPFGEAAELEPEERQLAG